MRLVTIGELDAHREESPELIGSEAVEDIGEAVENVLSIRAGTAAWPRVARRFAGFSQPQLGLEERVRRKLILANILTKIFNLGHGAIGEAIEVAGAWQFGRLHKEALKSQLH